MSSRTAADMAILAPSVRMLHPDRPHASAVALRDRTPVDCDPDDLLELPVVLTVVDGRVVHRAA